MTIIVVDDNSDLADSLAEILREEFPQHGLAVGYDGEQALRLARDQRPHLVLIDLEMPVLGGVEAAREMRRRMPRPPKLTLIAMTGNPIAAESANDSRTFDHVLSKPLDIERLISLVAAA